MRYLSIIFTMIIFIGLSACKKEDDLSQNEQLTLDIEKIENYLNEHDLEADKTNSGLYYIISSPGSGTYPSATSTVTVQYDGKLLDGTAFDDGTITSPLSRLIQGWIEGIPLLKSGGRGRLFIPSYMGYGAGGSGKVPANAVLIFDIHLISYY